MTRKPFVYPGTLKVSKADLRRQLKAAVENTSKRPVSPRRKPEKRLEGTKEND